MIRVSSLLAACIAVCGCADPLDARCRSGDGLACGVLADRARHASKGDGDLPRICDLYRRACAGGNDTGCANLGALLAQGKCPGGSAEALDVLQRACDHGDVGGCNNLGMVLRDGAGGAPVDRARAATLFRKACEHAATACENLAALLEDADPAGATAAYRTGCALADVSAASAACCYKLGLGELASADPGEKARAAAHFRQACSRDHAGACNNLGLMHAGGIGVPRDDAQAVELLQKACDGGELRACANAGSRYLLGEGVTRDAARGKALIARACDGGVEEACKPPAP